MPESPSPLPHCTGVQLNAPTRTACLVCGAQAAQLLWPVRANADGPLSGYEVWRCCQCSAGQTCPLPSPAELSAHYQKGIYRQSGGRANRLIDLVLGVLHDQRLREIARFCPPPGRLLDIGCGKGRFVAQAARRGWDAQGIDTVTGQVEAARARYNIRVSVGQVWEMGFEDASFDVITAWHVLEHLPDPHLVLAQVRRILRPGGIFVCEVPNLASWQAALGQGDWFHLDAPRHLIHYTPLAIHHLLSRHGIQAVRTYTFSAELGIFGMLQTALNRTGLPPNLLFQWLKKSARANKGMLMLNLAAALAAFAPSLLTESLASLARQGGVIRTLAVVP